MQLSATPLPIAKPENVAQIQQNLTAYHRIFAGLPGIVFSEEEDVTWTTSVAAPGSVVLRTQLPDEGSAQRLAAIFRQIAQRSRQFDWFVFPSCTPADLGERLVAYGATGGPDGAWQLTGTIGGPAGTWMFTDLAELVHAPAVAERFHVEPVTDGAGLIEWGHATIDGFGQDPAWHDKLDENPYYAAYKRHGFGDDAISLHYVGYLDDEPVTSSTLLLAGGIAGLFDISTPPKHRRQGFGSAISWAMLQDAQRRGYQTAYVWSSDMGRGVYQGVGFVPHNIGLREYSWQKRI